MDDLIHRIGDEHPAPPRGEETPLNDELVSILWTSLYEGSDIYNLLYEEAGVTVSSEARVIGNHQHPLPDVDETAVHRHIDMAIYDPSDGGKLVGHENKYKRSDLIDSGQIEEELYQLASIANRVEAAEYTLVVTTDDYVEPPLVDEFDRVVWIGWRPDVAPHINEAEYEDFNPAFRTELRRLKGLIEAEGLYKSDDSLYDVVPTKEDVEETKRWLKTLRSAIENQVRNIEAVTDIRTVGHHFTHRVFVSFGGWGDAAEIKIEIWLPGDGSYMSSDRVNQSDPVVTVALQATSEASIDIIDELPAEVFNELDRLKFDARRGGESWHDNWNFSKPIPLRDVDFPIPTDERLKEVTEAVRVIRDTVNPHLKER